jgi:hypothetical protein
MTRFRPPGKSSSVGDDANGLLSQTQAAELLDLTPLTLRRWRKRPDFPRDLEVRVGGRTKYRRVVIDRLRQGFPTVD